MAAQMPDKPLAPVTFFLGDQVKVKWVKPDEKGSAILGYKVYFLESDGIKYSLELHDCDGGESTIRNAQECTVEVLTLMATPYKLEWGDSVYTKLIAYNKYGDSELSEAGNGAIIITFPDAPVDLVETVASRTASSITFTWSDGLKDGGSSI